MTDDQRLVSPTQTTTDNELATTDNELATTGGGTARSATAQELHSDEEAGAARSPSQGSAIQSGVLNPTRFVTRTLQPVPACPIDDFRLALGVIIDQERLAPAAVVEAAAYSLAMVVRSALGLSASEAQLLFIATPSFSGAVALAAARVLLHAGAEICPIIYARHSHESSLPYESGEPGSPWHTEFERQCETLIALGRTPINRDADELTDTLSPEFPNSHALILGVADPLCPIRPLSDGEKVLCTALNEHPLPIHSVLAPLGLLESRDFPEISPLYSSSTLSLGVPLEVSPYEVQFLGRHYLADISLPRQLFGPQYQTPLFTDQPVIQIIEAPPENASDAG